MSKALLRVLIIALVVAACGWVLLPVWQWYKTGRLIEAEVSLRQKRAEDVTILLRKPRYQWTKVTASTVKPTYPISGYTLPPVIDFARVVAYQDKDQILYVYLDSGDRVIATFLARS